MARLRIATPRSILHPVRDAATIYASVTEICAVVRAFGPVNGYLARRVFTAAMADAGIGHKVEQVGLIEHIVPTLRQSGG